MKNYEIMLLLKADQTEAKTQKILKDFQAEIKKTDGKILSEDIWGRRELAYPVEKEIEGFYVVYTFEFNPSALTEFENSLRLNNNILRYLITIPPQGRESVAYANEIEEERKLRQEKKELTEKKIAEKEKAEDAKFKLKAERSQKKIMRKIEENIADTKEKSTEEKKSTSVDKDFDAKLSKIIDTDLDL